MIDFPEEAKTPRPCRAWMKILAVAAPLLATGCGGNLLGLNVFVVGERSALERQVLGSYEELGRDLTAYASVRGVNTDGTLKPAPLTTDSQQAVLRALNNRRYNRDDVNSLLAAGAVGEGNGGLLVVREESLAQQTDLNAPLVSTVLEEENADRAAILLRLVETTPGVSEQNRSEVAWIFATLNQELAPAGTMLQTREGIWVRK